MKVLVIEDDENLAELIKRTLEPISAEITCVRTLAEGMAEVARVPAPEVVTLDLNLPDSTATETLERVKTLREKNENALILIVTGALDISHRSKAIEFGADDFIVKHEAFAPPSGFMKNLRDVVRSLVRQPTAYQRSGHILEKLSSKLVDYFESLPPAEAAKKIVPLGLLVAALSMK